MRFPDSLRGNQDGEVLPLIGKTNTRFCRFYMYAMISPHSVKRPFNKVAFTEPSINLTVPLGVSKKKKLHRTVDCLQFAFNLLDPSIS